MPIKIIYDMNLIEFKTFLTVIEEKGIHLNTDFIDNSAGVNMSDYEVNIKILLQL